MEHEIIAPLGKFITELDKTPAALLIALKKELAHVQQLLLQLYPSPAESSSDGYNIDQLLRVLMTDVYYHVRKIYVYLDFLNTVDENVAHQNVYQECISVISPGAFIDQLRIIKSNQRLQTISRYMDCAKLKYYHAAAAPAFEACIHEQEQVMEVERINNVITHIDTSVFKMAFVSEIVKKIKI